MQLKEKEAKWWQIFSQNRFPIPSAQLEFHQDKSRGGQPALSGLPAVDRSLIHSRFCKHKPPVFTADSDTILNLRV